MSVKLCREKLDREKPNLPIVIPIEKLNIKSSISADSSLKSKGSKTHPKSSSKVHKVINVHLYLLLLKVHKIIYLLIKENVNHRANATIKKKDVDNNGLLFQQNNLKHQRDIDEHKLKVFF